MPVLRIREQGRLADGTFRVAVSFDQREEDEPVNLRDPFTDRQEADLAWNFEDYLRFPFVEGVRARVAATSIVPYGEQLFVQLFPPGSAAYLAYQFARHDDIGTLRVEVVGKPTFHRLHWEALKDPALPQAFALDVPVSRVLLTRPVEPAVLRSAPIIRVLLVTARPFGRRDVGYRTISRPLLELLRQAKLPVQIDLLRPATYASLDRHLQAATADHGAGYYHIIHLDTHGAVLAYRELQRTTEASRYLYAAPALQSRPGRPDLIPYTGEKAFLFLEA
jgi:hypothetical protein